jgi:hypothetical protein
MTGRGTFGLTLFPQPPSRHSDITGERCFHIVIPLFIGIIGFIMAISTMRLAARYVALYVYHPIPIWSTPDLWPAS